MAPLTVVALHCCGRAWDRALSAGRVRLLLGARTLLLVTDTARLAYWWVTTVRQVAYALGSVSRHEFLEALTRDYADVVSFVNSRVPKESRILMLLEARGYYFQVPVLQDNAIVNWPLLSAKAGSPDCLRSVGITHVLLNVGNMQYYRWRGLDLAPLRLDLLRNFAERCPSPIYSGGGFRIFQVHPGIGRRGE